MVSRTYETFHSLGLGKEFTTNDVEVRPILIINRRNQHTVNASNLLVVISQRIRQPEVTLVIRMKRLSSEVWEEHSSA